MKHWIKISAVSLLLFFAVCMAALVFWINPLLKSALENLGSSVLGTELRIESVAVRPLRGSLRAKGIRVGNPIGFSTPEMLEINEVLIQINVRSLSGKTIVIRRILINQPELTLERNGDQDNLRALLEQRKEPMAPTEEATPENPRRIAIHELQILKPRIRFIQAAPDNKKVAVTAESLSFRQSVSSLEIKGLKIQNPTGYTSPHLLLAGDIAAEAHWPHIGSFRLGGFRIESPQLLREKGIAGDNLTEFRKLLMPFFRGAVSEEAAAHVNPPGLDSSFSWIPGQMVIANGKLLSFNPRLPEPMRTELSFHRFAVQPREGIARIRQLAVANPRRFSHAHLVELEEFQIGIDPATFGKETLRILEIQIIAPRFAYERRFRTDNIEVFQKNMLALAGSVDAAKMEKPEEPDAGSTSSKVVVNHLLVRDGKVQAKLSKLPSMPVSLPTIERFNLGYEEGGASYTTLTHEITGVIYQTIRQSVTGIGGLTVDAIKGIGNLFKNDESLEE